MSDEIKRIIRKTLEKMNIAHEWDGQETDLFDEILKIKFERNLDSNTITKEAKTLVAEAVGRIKGRKGRFQNTLTLPTVSETNTSAPKTFNLRSRTVTVGDRENNVNERNPDEAAVVGEGESEDVFFPGPFLDITPREEDPEADTSNENNLRNEQVNQARVSEVEGLNNLSMEITPRPARRNGVCGRQIGCPFRNFDLNLSDTLEEQNDAEAENAEAQNPQNEENVGAEGPIVFSNKPFPEIRIRKESDSENEVLEELTGTLQRISEIKGMTRTFEKARQLSEKMKI